MAYGDVALLPGVNVERTPTLLSAGVNSSQLIRYKDKLIQKYGGWQKYYPFGVSGVPRDLHAWEDLNGTGHLSVGTTLQLGVITGATSFANITPQQLTTNNAVNFSTIQNMNSVTIIDTGISTVTVFDCVYIATPIAIGGLVLFGTYQIQTIVGPTSYTINAASAATSTVNNGGATPLYTTTSGSALVSVAVANHGLAQFNPIFLQVSTTGNGVTIAGNYTVTNVADANDFSIVVSGQANASSSFSMNSGNAQLVYFITIGPTATGAGYGTGGYGEGGYGTGLVNSAQTGIPITATDWSSDNWGKLLLACPFGGAVYQFDPTGGYSNAGIVPTAPVYNTGIFVSTQYQMLFCYGSTQVTQLGLGQDPLLIKWSDIGDYTSFIPLQTNQAGSYRLSSGSVIRAGISTSNQNLFWTDLDLWAANYIGYPLVWGFNKIGTGAGAISSHAVQTLRSGVYWMGPSNFYVYNGANVIVIPCPIWDFVFQNLNTAFQQNVRAMPNTPFNEVGWLFPSAASTSGECDSYVKFNITEPGGPWDFGSLARSAWIDQTILGPPIGATPTAIIYQHETTENADGQPITSSFTTGYFYISEGQDFVFIDQIIPDFIYTSYGINASASAQISLTFNTINYPGDTPISYGPYIVNSTTEYISVRFRARQVSITVSSSDVGSFWRIGKVRFRFSPVGRR